MRRRAVATIIVAVLAVAAVLLVIEDHATPVSELEATSEIADSSAFVRHDTDAAADEDEAPMVELVQMQSLVNANGRIHSIAPAHGPYNGGNVVTIIGQGLAGQESDDISMVSIGGVPAQEVISHTATKILVRLSALEAGKVTPETLSELVVDSRSEGVTKLTQAYTYHSKPIVFAVSPDNGPHVGGSLFEIKGRNLCASDDKSLTLRICGVQACGGRTNVECGCMMDGAKVMANVPKDHRGSTGGPCSVLVESATRGPAKASQAFTYRAAPAITAVTPTEGPRSGSNSIVVSGAALSAGQAGTGERVTAKVGGIAAVVTAYTPDAITITVPPGIKASGLVDVSVESRHQGTAVSAGLYTVHPAPRIARVHPTAAQAWGGEVLSIYARHMGLDVTRTMIGDHEAQVLDVIPQGGSHVLVKVRTPRFNRDEDNKLHNIVVTSASRGIARMEKYMVRGRGTIAAINPSRGPAQGGTRVTILGSGLSHRKGDILEAKVAGVEAKVLSESPSMVVVETSKGNPALDGGIELLSKSVGHIKAHTMNTKFRYSRGGQVVRVLPAQGAHEGGEEVVLEGSRLCGDPECEDLDYVRVGAAKVRKFLFKAPNRVVFLSPPAAAAGAVPLHNVAVVSRMRGEAVAVHAFEYLRHRAIGKVYPHNVPLEGGSTVTIRGPNLGSGEEYNVLLAGVQAKVLSASKSKLTVQAGDAKLFGKKNALALDRGLEGTIVIEVRNSGVTNGVDSLIGFRYNAKCALNSVKAEHGPADGEMTLVLSGSHLGMGDERVTVDGATIADPGLTMRHRDDDDVQELRVRVPAATLQSRDGMPKQVMVMSHRTGTCHWKAPKKTATENQATAEHAQVRVVTKKAVNAFAKGAKAFGVPKAEAKKLEAKAVKRKGARALKLKGHVGAAHVGGSKAPGVQEEISVTPIKQAKKGGKAKKHEDAEVAAQEYIAAATKDANENAQEKQQLANDTRELKELTKVHDDGVAAFYP